MGAIQSSFESKFGSSHQKQPPDVFCKKGVLKDFTKFTGKHLFQSLKKETLVQLFSCEFCEISKNAFFYRTPLVAASAGSQNILKAFTPGFTFCKMTCQWFHPKRIEPPSYLNQRYRLIWDRNCVMRFMRNFSFFLVTINWVKFSHVK